MKKLLIVIAALILSPLAMADWCGSSATYQEANRCYSNLILIDKQKLRKNVLAVIQHPSMTQEKLDAFKREQTQWEGSVDAQCRDNACVYKSIQVRNESLQSLLKSMGGATAAVEPSFNCNKASNNIEKAICSNSTLATLDNKLAEAYRRIREVSENPDNEKKEQATWVRETRNACKTVECLIQVYNERIDDLESASSYLSKPAAFR